MSQSPRKRSGTPPPEGPPPRVSFTAEAAVGTPRPATRKALALAAIILGSSLAFIDSSIVGVALPAIQGELNASPGLIQWVTNGYLLALGALVLVGGAAGDRYGRRRVFIAGTVIFTVASVLCGAVWTAENLIAGRILQGLGAALLVPTALALIPVCFDSHERGRALGVWAGASALGAALGPVLGGWLTDAVTWRAVFLINVPVAVLAVLLAVFAIPESRDREAGSPDWLGAGLAVLTLGLLGWGLSAATEWGLASLRFWAVLTASAAALAAFLAVEKRARQPMLPLALFRSRAFTGVNLATVSLYLALSGVLYLLPFEWMRVDEVSATQVGAGLLPFAAIMGLGSPLAGRLAERIGPRPFLVGGPALVAAGLLLMIWPPVGADYWTAWFPGIVLLALGMTVTVAPLTAALFSSVDAHRASVASGVNNAAARIGGMVAIALFTLVLSLAFEGALQRADAGARLAAVMGGGGFQGAVSEVEKAAFRLGFQICMGVGALFALAASAAAALTAPKGPAPSAD
ncbi:MAG: MFS transporter [Caulobacteraceae bacterium]|nr:MFS transporter [Caulobacteraceae bacterium]